MRLRPAQPDDADAVARIHVRAWQVAYRGLLPQDYLDGLRPEDRAKRYTFGSCDADQPATIVAIEKDAIVGWATTVPARDIDCACEGELAAMYVDRDAWSRGVGKALIARGANTLSLFDDAGESCQDQRNEDPSCHTVPS